MDVDDLAALGDQHREAVEGLRRVLAAYVLHCKRIAETEAEAEPLRQAAVLDLCAASIAGLALGIARESRETGTEGPTVLLKVYERLLAAVQGNAEPAIMGSVGIA